VPSLLLKDGPEGGHTIAVESELLIGRVNAPLTIDDPLVSRRHAVVRPVGGTLEIEDLGSLNGTWVNGERIEGKRLLKAGDVVGVGSTTMEIEVEPAEQFTVLAEVTTPPRGPGAPPPVAPSPRPAPGPAVPEPAAAEPGVEPPPAEAPVPPPPAPPAQKEPAEVISVGAEDELRPVTALFADIVGSTSLGERLKPAEVKALIGDCVTRMTRAVEEFGGTVGAYMGDGIAAFYGVPSAHEDDPERAARAALRILEEVARYAREVESAWGISDFNARVGINTGEVAVGLVGSADPQAISLGDTNNVAARLQGVADPGTIAVGQATARAIVHRFVLEPLGEVTVKGRVQPVEAWRLVGTQTVEEAGPQTPLVGREPEVEQLQRVIDELTAGRGQIGFLLGDGGIGKTRLLGELRTLADDRVTWMEGRCYSYGTRLLYGPFIQMLRGWLGVEDGEAELSVRTKLRAKLGLLPASQLRDVLPYLSRLLSVQLDSETDEHLRLLSPEELGTEIRRAYTTWIASLASQGPLVVALEDLHWADPPSCRLAEELLELVDLAPLLVVATSRVDPGSEGWQLRVRALTHHVHRSLELPLMPLSEPAARELLAALPASKPLSESELDQIVAGAEGNPLYLEELLSAWVDAGARRQHTWAPTVTGARALTPTLESLLLARIDRLPRGARRLAQVAAIIGRFFPLRVLEHVAENQNLENDLASLLRADIIRELRRYPEPEYTFRHGLLREASLSTLPPARRRELYGAVGAAFESLFSATLDDHLEVLAHYYSRGPDLRKGLEYLERAGVRAYELDAVDRAAELWRRAFKVAEQLEDTTSQQRLNARLAPFLAGGHHDAGKTPGA
jgi:class 3 adenylate cyclase